MSARKAIRNSSAGSGALVKAKNPTLKPFQYIEQVEDTGYPWECTRRGVPVKTNRVDALCAVMNLEDCGLVNERTDACE